MFSFISKLSLQTKAFLIFSIFVSGLFIGCFSTYKIIGFKNDSEELAVKKASEVFIEEYRKNESGKAKILQDKLESLRANEKEIIREIPKIINRPVYRNDCIDVDGLSAIERARTGKANTDSPSEEIQ